MEKLLKSNIEKLHNRIIEMSNNNLMPEQWEQLIKILYSLNERNLDTVLFFAKEFICQKKLMNPLKQLTRLILNTCKNII